MAIAFVQKSTTNGNSPQLAGVVAGNLIVLNTSFFQANGGGAVDPTPTDSQSQTVRTGLAPVPANYVGASSTDDVGTSTFYIENALSGTHTLTCTTHSSKNRTISEFSGLALSSSIDVTDSGTTTNTSHTSRTTGSGVTTTKADELAVIVHSLGAKGGASPVGNAGTTYGDSAVSGYTNLQTVDNDLSDIATQHAYKILSSTGSQQATFTWTAAEANMGSQGHIVTFKAAGDTTRPMFRGH